METYRGFRGPSYPDMSPCRGKRAPSALVNWPCLDDPHGARGRDDRVEADAQPSSVLRYVGQAPLQVVGVHDGELRMAVNGALEIAVTDDGPPTPQWRPGVGLTSMCKRAAWLGCRPR